MTPAKLQQLRDKLAANRQPVFRAEQNAHPRGWNDCLDFIERSIKEIMGESNDKPVAT
jgi:hypothetical protein